MNETQPSLPANASSSLSSMWKKQTLKLWNVLMGKGIPPTDQLTEILVLKCLKSSFFAFSLKHPNTQRRKKSSFIWRWVHWPLTRTVVCAWPHRARIACAAPRWHSPFCELQKCLRCSTAICEPHLVFPVDRVGLPRPEIIEFLVNKLFHVQTSIFGNFSRRT